MVQKEITSNHTTWQEKVEEFAKEHGWTRGSKTGSLTYISGKHTIVTSSEHKKD